ncbi:MAG: hypothetical protein GY820_00090, partial [Gammaproteobacteria bacterium]|nr:hypothetical protein [Gammaproteobacteria bacterium]
MDNTAVIESFVKSLDPQGLQLCYNLVSQELANQSFQPIPNINDYVDYHKNFVDPTEESIIASEIESLGFNFRSNSEAVQNKFISTFKDPYKWDSKGEKVVNDPLDIDKFPGIRDLMG